MVEEKPKDRLIHVRLDEDLHRKLRVHCAELDVSIQEWVERAVRETLKEEKRKER